MKVLQLCFFTNYWPDYVNVTSIDLKSGQDVMSLKLSYGHGFDLILAAPPCTQFTKANTAARSIFPKKDVLLVLHILDICRNSGAYWLIENPPGRIEQFIPSLTQYRILTWSGYDSNKEYVLYSNFLVMHTGAQRYGKSNIPKSKLEKEKWLPELFMSIYNAQKNLLG